jgi:hypothetical protein
MTDDEKVQIMFEIRREEIKGDINLEAAAERVSKHLTPAHASYWALLKLYNKRFPAQR